MNKKWIESQSHDDRMLDGFIENEEICIQIRHIPCSWVEMLHAHGIRCQFLMCPPYWDIARLLKSSINQLLIELIEIVANLLFAMRENVSRTEFKTVEIISIVPLLLFAHTRNSHSVQAPSSYVEVFVLAIKCRCRWASNYAKREISWPNGTKLS